MLSLPVQVCLVNNSEPPPPPTTPTFSILLFLECDRDRLRCFSYNLLPNAVVVFGEGDGDRLRTLYPSEPPSSTAAEEETTLEGVRAAVSSFICSTCSFAEATRSKFVEDMGDAGGIPVPGDEMVIDLLVPTNSVDVSIPRGVVAPGVGADELSDRGVEGVVALVVLFSFIRLIRRCRALVLIALLNRALLLVYPLELIVDEVCCDPASPSEACVELSSAVKSVVLAVRVDMYDGLFVIIPPSDDWVVLNVSSVESYV